jgi:hypothetical protein
MDRLLIVILAICTLPRYAHGAGQPVAADLKAEARIAVGTIGADKHKTQTYCQILDLERQQADQEKNNNKKKVGPEFVTLDNILKRLDLTSPDGREIALIIQSLNQSCPE